MLQCDYLSFTFKPSRLPYLERERITKKLEARHNPDEAFRITDLDFFFEVFPEISAHITEFCISERARYYKRFHAFNDCCYIYDDDGYMGNKGVNVEFPSHGLYLLKEWFNLDGSDILLRFAPLLFSRGCSVSRLDVCVDIPLDKCTVNPKDWIYWSYKGLLKTHYRSIEACGSKSDDFLIKLINGGDGGATFYLGSRRNQMLRVYDKNVESEGANVSIRYEIESHRDKAQDILMQYLKNQFDFKDLLLSMVDVLEFTDDVTNRCRIRRNEKFEDFLNSCLTNSDKVMYIPTKRVPPTLYQKQAWVLRIYNAILELEYIDSSFRHTLLDLKNEFVPSDKAIKMKQYLHSLSKL